MHRRRQAPVRTQRLVLAGLLFAKLWARTTSAPAPELGYLRNLAIRARARRADCEFDLSPEILIEDQRQHR